jgi:hypothetical protein
MAPNNLAGSSVTYAATSGSAPILSSWTYRNLAVNGSGATYRTTGALTVNEVLTLSGGTLQLSGPATLYGLTVKSGTSFVQGSGNNLTLYGNLHLAAGTFTKDTGNGQVRLYADLILDPNNNDLGNVVIGP